MPKVHNNRVVSGSRFEEEVHEIYSAMGYEVSRNVRLSGQQVDLIAEQYLPGVGRIRIMVECKFKGGRACAGNADVQSIAGAWQLSKLQDGITACVIITTNGFSLDAQSAASSAGITLLTRTQLLRSAIDFSDYAKKICTDYDAKFLGNGVCWYIDPSAKSGKSTHPSLEGYVREWMARNKKRPLAMLGGYGTGKSSFCTHLAQSLLRIQALPIPIIITLRDFNKTMRIESLIRDFLEEKCPSSPPRYSVFKRMFDGGLILLLLDGFDEMANRADSTTIEANLIEIEKFAGPSGNLIVTCRPEYFVSRREQSSMLGPERGFSSERSADFEIVDIDLWDPTKVENYVRNRIAGSSQSPSIDASYFLDKVRNLPALSDVSTRAVHLELIVRMLPVLVERNMPITRRNLYATYIESELKRETFQNRRLQVISDAQRVALLTEIAAKQLVSSNNTLSFELAANIIKASLALPETKVEIVTRDFLNRSFLHRDGDSYSFAHKSIGEYLLASEIHRQLLAGDFTVVGAHDVTSAVAGMVLEMFGGISSINRMVDILKIRDVSPGLKRDMFRHKFVANGMVDLLQAAMSSPGVFNPRSSQRDQKRIWIAAMVHDANNCIAPFLMGEQIGASGDSAKDLAIDEAISRSWNHILHFALAFETFEADLDTDSPIELRPSSGELDYLLEAASGDKDRTQIDISGRAKYFGDMRLLFRAFLNIIENARAAIGSAPDGRIVVRLEKEETCVRITFSNNGPRIPAKRLKDIFTSGYSSKEARGHHGLGLSIVKQIVELHGGSVSVSSEPTETRFTLFLPVKSVAETKGLIA